MTTSIDPSVDELLLLQESQYHMSNFIFANVKPIGAERKNGQFSNASISQTKSPQRLIYPSNMDFIQENNNYLNSFEIPSTTSFKSSAIPVHDHFYFSSNEEPIIQQTNKELESLTAPSYYNHSPRPSTHLIDNYNYQRQTSFTRQKYDQSILTRPHTDLNKNYSSGKTIPSFHAPQTYPTNQFFSPHSSQLYSRNPFLNISQQTRSVPPIFTPPFQCTRERFQVNSIGRPILRGNNHNHTSQVHSFKVRQ